MFTGSSLRNENLGAQILRTGLAQHLPGHGGVRVAQLRELGPELTAAALLDARGGHVHLGPLVASSLDLLLRSLGGRGQLRGAGLDLLAESILGGLHGVGATLTEELIDVARKHLGVREHDVIRRVVFRSGIHNHLVLLQCFAQLLDRTSGLLELAGVLLLHRRDVLGLLDESILEDAAISVQESRGLLAEVLKNLQALKTYGV